jgi:pyroglutamyl-peptidase
MTVILTGFEPFGGDSVNPTAMLVRDLDGASIQGVPIRVLLIPVSVQAIQKVASDLQSCVESDTILIGTGLANGRSGLFIERVAINCCDFPIPDNEGTVLIDKPIVTGGAGSVFFDIANQADYKGLAGRRY